MNRAVVAGIVLSLGFLSACRSVNHYSPPEQLFPGEKKLIITADDYGINNHINDGIELGIEKGIVTTVSVLINLPGAPSRLKKAAGSYPHIGWGLHCNLTSGRPVSSPGTVSSLIDKDGTFFTVETLICRLPKVDLVELKRELRNQIELFLSTGVVLDHLSSQHNILMLYDPFFTVMLELAQEFGLPVRSPIVFSVADPFFSNAETKKRALTLIRAAWLKNPLFFFSLGDGHTMKGMGRNRETLHQHGIPHPDVLIDVFWGSPYPEQLLSIFQRLPEGVSELVVHLGLYNSESPIPKGIEGEYLMERELELCLITSPLVRRWLDTYNITLATYADVR